MSRVDRPSNLDATGAFDPASFGDIPDPVALKPAAKATGSRDGAVARLRDEPRALTRAEVRRRRWLAFGVSALWLGAFVGGLGLRRDLMAHPATLLGHVIVPAALGAIALYLAVAPGRLGLGATVGWLRGATVSAPIAFAALAALGATSFDLREPAFFRHAFVCGAVSIALALVPMLAATIGLRRVCVTAAPWRSSLVGVGVGLAAASTLGLHCSEGGGYHVLLGHVAPVALLALLAMVVVRRFARVD